MMCKKIFSIVLALVMCLCVVPVFADGVALSLGDNTMSEDVEYAFTAQESAFYTFTTSFVANPEMEDEAYAYADIYSEGLSYYDYDGETEQAVEYYYLNSGDTLKVWGYCNECAEFTLTIAQCEPITDIQLMQGKENLQKFFDFDVTGGESPEENFIDFYNVVEITLGTDIVLPMYVFSVELGENTIVNGDNTVTGEFDGIEYTFEFLAYSADDYIDEIILPDDFAMQAVREDEECIRFDVDGNFENCFAVLKGGEQIAPSDLSFGILEYEVEEGIIVRLNYGIEIEGDDYYYMVFDSLYSDGTVYIQEEFEISDDIGDDIGDDTGGNFIDGTVAFLDSLLRAIEVIMTVLMVLLEFYASIQGVIE